MNGKNAPAIFASALAALLMLTGLAFAGLPTVYHPAGDIMPGNFSGGVYAFPNASKVGIGTTSPTANLDVTGSVAASASITTNGSMNIMRPADGCNAGILNIWDTTNNRGWHITNRRGCEGSLNDLKFWFWNSISWEENVVFKPGGNVGIGTGSPDARLTIQSAATGSGLHIRASENAPDYMLKVEDQDGSVQGMYIDDLGRVGMGTTSPNASLHINTSRAVINSCGGNWLNDASAIMFRQNPGGGCGDDAYIAYYTTAPDKTVLEIAARNDGPPIQDDIALMANAVGIGTTSPDGLQVNLAVSESARSADNVRLGVLAGTPRIIFEDSASATQHEIDNYAGTMRFFRPGIVSMAIDSTGNVGIGTGSPDARLTIQNGATGSGLHIRAGENEPDYIMKVEDQDGSVQAMYITTNGNVGIGTTSPTNILSVVQNSGTDPIADSWTVYSSRDYKTNITALSDEELAEILGKAVETKLYHYTFKNDSTGKVKLGIIAEEAPAQILAEGGKAESVNEYVAFLHAAIKAQHKEMEDLKAANEELKQRVTRLEEKG